MRIMTKLDELDELANCLKEISEQLEDVSHLFKKEMIQEANFSGRMAEVYYKFVQELMGEHEKMIQFYLQLSTEIKEMVKDYDQLDENILKKIQNI